MIQLSLIIVGFRMIDNVEKINWNESDEAFPAFLIILSISLTSSIAKPVLQSDLFHVCTL
ncbi:hypothetical protein [Domibacillus mangrovi]|uniref:Uncharacterized protein n=1 Tax=Domibacillus mangrovi TaxID=1714354 RepID=A0A1Q5P0N5_9BACI|nr:hypothetical protein [Domibacillus mangrovi]OKL35807.1 hypothetical protein BLL40_13055 [Domibacillus mangrovi]